MIINVSPKHEFVYERTHVKVFHANKGEGLIEHMHVYSHATVCHNGSCRVSLPGRSYVINKNSKPLNLPPNEPHEIEALEDNTVFVNIFADGKN